MAIHEHAIDSWKMSFEEDPKNRLAMNAMTQNSIPLVPPNRTGVDNVNFIFSTQIDTAEATNQERSGMCWLLLIDADASYRYNLRILNVGDGHTWKSCNAP
jgi:aminopeptidase C